MALSARVVQHFIATALKQQGMSNKIPASSAQSVSYGNLRFIKLACILQAYISEAKAEEARRVARRGTKRHSENENIYSLEMKCTSKN
jgi:hypothetical protein